jgi:LDH2 family malate/lactate/ureidoglycolate dehydrogenase
MATSVVPRGKVEVYDRNIQQMPVGWTVDEHGYDAQNPAHVLKNLAERIGGGILPLGGRGELYSGHKGYGLAFMVDILTGVLSGAAYGPDVHNLKRPMPDGQLATPDVGHFFLAMDVSRFMPLETFEDRLDDLIDRLKDSKKALDQEAIFFHGEQSWARTRAHEEHGIPMAENVMCTLVDIAKACDHPPPTVQPDRQAA